MIDLCVCLNILQTEVAERIIQNMNTSAAIANVLIVQIGKRKSVASFKYAPI